MCSDETSDYYGFVTGERAANGTGINLFCEYNGGYCIITDS